MRATLRAKRDAHVLDHPDPAGAFATPPELLALIDAARVVACYVAVGSEADPRPIVDRLRAMGRIVALPVVTTRADPIRFVEWAPDVPLIAGPLGLRQPGPELSDIAPDLILAPLLGFDDALGRLGQGAGHYDRAFAAHPAAIRVGLAWEMQRVDRLPTDPWDVPLNAILTERRWIAAS